jgi:hypothetical protein
MLVFGFAHNGTLISNAQHQRPGADNRSTWKQKVIAGFAACNGSAILLSFKLQIDLVFCLLATWSMFPNNLYQYIEKRLPFPLSGLCELLLHQWNICWMAILDAFLQPFDGLAVAEALSRNSGVSPNEYEPILWGSKSAAKDIVECVQIAIPAILTFEGYLAEVVCKTGKVAELARIDGDLRSHTLAERRG